MLLILGKGGHAEEVGDIARAMNFDAWHYVGPGDDEKWRAALSVVVALGTGTPAIRERLSREYATANWVRMIHPRATISPSAKIEPGAVIAAGAIVGPGCYVGRFALVNFNATLGHGAQLDDGAIVLPGANLACDAQVGAWATIGAGAQLLPKVSVGAWAVVGSSSMVARDVPERHSAVGVPARVMRLDDER